MSELQELLERVVQSEGVRNVGDRSRRSTVYGRWMIEATARIEELELRVSQLESRGWRRRFSALRNRKETTP